ncbi:MAG: AbrB family transcriptional regulator [Silicimonas sp.]|nr:AbrB family transcriptional regulator [Silicimonas sp.]
MCGALAAVFINMPLPWMLGAMFTVMVVAILGANLTAPAKLRGVMVPILGVMLGSGFSPAIFSNAADWAVTLAILPFFIVAAFGAAYVIYRRVGRYDPVTAFYASAPGGVNDMILMGAEAGGDERRIAMAHAGRIFMVVTLVVLFYTLVLEVETTGDSRPFISFADVGLRDLSILAACAIAGAYLGPKVGLPAPIILGPMILSGLVHVTGVTHAAPPTVAVNATQLVMGTVIGCRFAGANPHAVMKDLGLSLVVATAMLIVAVPVALSVSMLTGIDIRETFLSFSPGGLPEMSILALSLDADIAYIATVHIIRIVLVIALAPLFFRLIRR